MAGLFSKIFGTKKEKSNGQGGAESYVDELISDIIEKGGFDLSYEVETNKDKELVVELFGADDELLKEKDGQVLDALQLFFKRALQNREPNNTPPITVDCDGFREEANQSLIELAEKLRDICVDKGKPVYFRALPPRDRKVVHQYLAEDGRVKSRSVGEGLYKKIKIFPNKGDRTRDTSAEQSGV